MIQYFKILLFMAMGFVSTVFAQAQTAEVSVSTKLERDTILIGDQVVYSITAKIPEIIKVKFPTIADSLGNGISVVGSPSVVSTENDGSITYTIRMLITAFDSGYHMIPEIFFELEHEGQIDSIFSPQRPLMVNVIPKNPDQNDLCDIKPPLREPITFSEVAPWTGLFLLLIGAIVLLIFYISKRKENKPFLSISKPAEPAHIIALRELADVKEQKLWSSENHKLYYTKLTDILRNYFEGRFNIDAQEKTSTEILAELQKVDYNFDSKFQQLQDLLFNADLVKFAKHLPLISENEQYLNFSIDFVNSTKPDEKPVDRPAENNDVVVSENNENK